MKAAMTKAVREFLAEIGQKGGRSRSKAKRRAVRRNVAKARQARRARREKGGAR